MKPEHGSTLKRGITKWELVLLLINSVIGAGIFGLPSKIFALSGVYGLLAFVACTVVVMIFVLCFAEVSSRFVETGGPYLYALTAFGRLPAFLTGWLLILSRIFNYATLINLLMIYASYFNESLNRPYIRTSGILLTTTLLAYVNYRGIRNATWMSNILTIAKLLPLTLFIVIGLFHIEPALFARDHAFEPASFNTSVLLLIFAFGGFESILVNTGEVDNPQKNIPFALITSAIIIGIYYCLIQLVCIGTLPGLAASERPLADAARQFTGGSGGSVIAAGALISIVGTLNVLILSGSRLPFALSVEKQLPATLAYIHPKFRTPTFSLTAMCLAYAVVSLLWSFFTALAVASVIRILVYLIVCASLIKLRKQERQQDSFFKLPHGHFFAIAGVAFALWLLAASKKSEIDVVAISLLAGIILYLLFIYSKKKRQAQANNRL